MAVELSFSPWADEMILTLVGACEPLPEALGKHNVTRADDLSDVLDRLEQRAAAQRGQPERPFWPSTGSTPTSLTPGRRRSS